MWEFFDGLITGIDDDIKVKDFLIGARWSVVLSYEGGIGIAPVFTERFDRFDISYTPRCEMTLKEMAMGIYKWNFFEASLALAAINAYYNAPSRAMSDAEHTPTGRRSKKAFKNFCSKYTTEGRSIFIEPYYDSDEMADIPGRIDVIRRDPEFRDYIYSAYDELIETSDRVFISGAAIVNRSVKGFVEKASALNKDIIFAGPDVPLAPSLSNHGVRDSFGFIVDDTDEFMNKAKSAMYRDDFLVLGHFAGLHFK